MSGPQVHNNLASRQDEYRQQQKDGAVNNQMNGSNDGPGQTIGQKSEGNVYTSVEGQRCRHKASPNESQSTPFNPLQDGLLEKVPDPDVEQRERKKRNTATYRQAIENFAVIRIDDPNHFAAFLRVRHARFLAVADYIFRMR